ncbi:MAG: SpoIIE family protein phosphatase [Gammaproteobacteria bacterium]|nr:SpoIIE family protein phosphatase [Gammaproteobacteria bacterium]
MIRSAAVRVQDKSGVAEARRLCLSFAESLGWGETDRGNAAIVATELASNLLKHARDGVLALTARSDGGHGRLDLLAVDQGPGMRDLESCLRDGFSTAGSPGTGLGAVARLSDRFDVTTSEQGTVVAAEIERGAPSASPRLNVSGLVLPKEGEESSGDGWECQMRRGALSLLVCDGIGHGHYANEATRAAVQAFRGRQWESPKEALGDIDVMLRPTRGAAAAVAMVDPAANKVRFCGVGNISATIVSAGDSRHLVSRSGILGHAPGRTPLALAGQARSAMTEFEYPWTADSALVLHSDGVGTRWRPDAWPGLWNRLPGNVAGTIFRDFGRGNDDVVVVVVRQE